MTNTEFQRNAVNSTGCVSSGWELAKQHYGLFLGIGVVAILIGVIPLVGLFLTGPLMVGIYGVYLKSMRGEPVEFSSMFEGFNKFVPAMAAGLVFSVPEIIFQIVRVSIRVSSMVLDNGVRSGADDYSANALMAGLSFLWIFLGMFFFIFGIVWRLAFFFVFPLMAERDIGPIDALKLSANAAFANLGSLLILLLIEVGITLVGLLACCIGIIFVLPLVYAANAFAYRQVFPLLNAPNPMVPPPPPSFGGAYGQGM